MKANILTIVFWFIGYVVTLQIAGYFLALYVVHINGPVLPIILIEQSSIPFVFGFYTYKYLQVKGILSPLIVLVIPVSLIIPSTTWDIFKGDNVTIFEHTLMFTIVVVMQLVFITLGAYFQYYKKIKQKLL